MRNRFALAILALGCAGLLVAFFNPIFSRAERDERTQIIAMADALKGDVAFDAGYDALDPSLALSGAGDGAALFDPKDDYSGLPRGDGHELVWGMCGACHSLQLVMQQRGDAGYWDGMITQMVSKHAMAAPEAADREILTRYLAQHFPPATSAQARSPVK
jgi:hypothetical protein